ncbi:MAG: nitrate reductase subunit beta [Gemmatimonadota bacterium]
MDVRAQVSMVFHLDKCIGCHTCSIACKNVWTDRRGTEYMWWNNVETKPGTGYPTLWEDQEKYRGGWELRDGKPRLRLQGKGSALANLFYNRKLPVLDDYYEPFTYRYQDLFDAPASDDQPTARPISMVTGREMEIEAGPNWDDDLGGSPVYAENDFNLKELSEVERRSLFETERMVHFYLPRICNHCLNAGCVAACPAGAIYKRGEDGVVLVNQQKCRAWRMCISGCPYKKVYYNWGTGKSEKCILCYPRLESGQAPACFHSCVGRIRYLGLLLYDADRIEATVCAPDGELVQAQRDLILDPFDPEVVAQAQRNGIDPLWVESAQKSPVYKYFKLWELALPLHPEARTLPMLFYVPPLLPVMASMETGRYEIDGTDYFGSLDEARVPIRYLARLFAAGNEEIVQACIRKLIAIRMWRRQRTVEGASEVGKAEEMLGQAGLTPDLADRIYRLTSLPTFEDRFVVPPYHREMAIEMMADPLVHKGSAGVGARAAPVRGP